MTSGLSNMISDLEDTLTREKNKLESDVEGIVRTMARNTRDEFDQLFVEIKDFFRDEGDKLKKDFDDIDQIFDDVKDKIENTAEAAYNSFTRKTNEEITKIENLASSSISKIESVSEYIRTRAADEIRAAINKAKSDFDIIKNTFSSDVSKVSEDIISKTKEAILDLKNSAENDVQKLNDLRKNVDNDIEEKFTDIKVMFVKAKNDSIKELESIAKLVRREIDFLEERIKGLEKNVKQITFYIALSSIFISIGAALIIIAEKEKRKTKIKFD